jgi:hypothetical protein
MIPNNKEKFAIACISISQHSMMRSSHKDIKTEFPMFFPRMNHTLNLLNVPHTSRFESHLSWIIGY